MCHLEFWKQKAKEELKEAPEGVGGTQSKENIFFFFFSRIYLGHSGGETATKVAFRLDNRVSGLGNPNLLDFHVSCYKTPKKNDQIRSSSLCPLVEVLCLFVCLFIVGF